jgi:hypothetical protein
MPKLPTKALKEGGKCKMGGGEGRIARISGYDIEKDDSGPQKHLHGKYKMDK